MKPFMLRVLPPVFRVIERLGLTLPRKFFKQPSEYTRIPKLPEDDNVIPSISEIPSFLTSMRHPRRHTVSIGPQSPADAYETMAYREKRRRGSVSASYASSSMGGLNNPKGDEPNGSIKTKSVANGFITLPVPKMSKWETYESMMGTGFDRGTKDGALVPPAADSSMVTTEVQKQEQDDRAMFSRLEKPRVRYDAEVVTNLIVYAGKQQLSFSMTFVFFFSLWLTSHTF